MKTMRALETFIVRIYRATATQAGEIAGTVERVGTGDRVGFCGRDQLFESLLRDALAGDDVHGLVIPAPEERE